VPPEDLRGLALAAGIDLPAAPVQASAAGPLATSDEQTHSIASQGVADAGGRLPHADAIIQSFGEEHRTAIEGIRAQVGGPATAATRAIGAEAYATGQSVAFGAPPDLHTAAHEAAHVLQQRSGVSLRGGVGQVGDPHEQHADQVADIVVRGESATSMLGPASSPTASSTGVQRVPAKDGAAGGSGEAPGGAAAGTPEIVQSPPQLSGRPVAAVARELKSELSTLMDCVNRVIQGALLQKGSLVNSDRHRAIQGAISMGMSIEEDERENPAAYDAVLPGLYQMLGQLAADLALPEDGASLHALAAAVVRDREAFEALARRESAISGGTLEAAKEESRHLGRMLKVVETVKEASFAGAALCAVVVAAPAGAAYGLAGEAGAGTLGGALTLGGLRAADKTDHRSLWRRTAAGAEEGALLGGAGAVGRSVGAVTRSVVDSVVGDSAAGQVISSAVTGAADTSTTAGTYASSVTLAQGGDLSDAARAGIQAAEIGAPMGAVLGVASRALTLPNGNTEASNGTGATGATEHTEGTEPAQQPTSLASGKVVDPLLEWSAMPALTRAEVGALVDRSASLGIDSIELGDMYNHIRAEGMRQLIHASDAEFRAANEAALLEKADDGHSLARHGPQNTDAELRHRVETGVAPDGQISPTRNSSRFVSYQKLVETRKAVLADFESHFGIGLDEPLPEGETVAAVRFEHGEQVGAGWRGRTGTKTGPQRYSAQDPLPEGEMTRTYTKLVWTGSRWKVVQHFPVPQEATPWEIEP